MKTTQIAIIPVMIACMNATEVMAEAAGESEVVVIVATGVGTTPDAAERDALMNAVQQAVGMYIDGETLVENSKLIHEQILSASNGFVKDYSVTVRPHKRPADDLFQMTIRANVIKGKVAERLRRAHLIDAEVKPDDAWAEAFTKKHSADEAAAIFSRYTEGLALLLLKPRLIGKHKEGTQPETLLDQTSGEMWCAWTVQVAFDRDRYYKEVQPRLEHLLSAMAVRIHQRAYDLQAAYSVPGPNGAGGRRLAMSDEKIRWYTSAQASDKIKSITRDEFAILLDTTGRDGLHQSFTLYVLPNRFQKLVEEAICRVAVELRVLDVNGELVEAGIINLDKTALLPLKRDRNDRLSPFQIPRGAVAPLGGERNDGRMPFHVPFDAVWYPVPETALIGKWDGVPVYNIGPGFILQQLGKTDDSIFSQKSSAVTNAVDLRWEVSLKESQVKRIGRIQVELVERGG